MACEAERTREELQIVTGMHHFKENLKKGTFLKHGKDNKKVFFNKDSHRATKYPRNTLKEFGSNITLNYKDATRSLGMFEVNRTSGHSQLIVLETL